ncbi:hypothetical protein ACHZ97_17805 [Lysobacter soli]|uniref:hypothetical protein n=1 Tax=Lysobacter soli TaxID=453783 RepID=UPI0037C6CDD0
MSMAHIWIVGLSACLISASCLAQDLPPEDPPEVVRAKVASVVKTHAGTIGCSVTVDARHVTPYMLEGGRVYVALYHADVGCSGGTSMGRPVLVVVRHAAYDTYMVDTRYSTPQQSPDNLPPTITQLAARDGRIELKGLALDPSDALCCPSRRVQGYLRLATGVNPKWDLVR